MHIGFSTGKFQSEFSGAVFLDRRPQARLYWKSPETYWEHQFYKRSLQVQGYKPREGEKAQAYNLTRSKHPLPATNQNKPTATEDQKQVHSW
jgi:hypothetical protein